MSISSYASDLSAASPSHSCDFTQSNPSPSSGMVQPVVNEMFATVHAAGSSLLGLFTSCATFDSTIRCIQTVTSKKMEPLTPRELSISTLCIHQIVPMLALLIFNFFSNPTNPN
eukprot:scaffold7444_cov88-Isochrysis_galbana.AAC.1